MNIKILDTNVILEHSLQEIVTTYGKEPTKLIIPFKVLMELDTFKKGNDVINYNARRSLGFLETLRKGNKLTEGAETDGVVIQVYVSENDILDPCKTDNSIILTASELKLFNDEVEIVSQDIHERLIAEAFNIKANEFDIEVDSEEIYNGKAYFNITDKQIGDFYGSGHFETKRQLLENQFTIMDDSTGTKHYGIHKGGCVYRLKDHYKAWDIKPKKHDDGEIIMEQAMFMHLLMDPSIQFITACGPSGCGKTLLTLACALEQTLDKEKYDKIVVMRPMVTIDRDLGALPGSKLEKIEPWMASTFDNLEYLFERYTHDKSFVLSGRDKIYELMEFGKLELEAMQFIRGRSIPNQFIIVDDAQNLTPHQATTIITRAGEGSKVVFLGDINKQQIDNHRLNSYNNGLSYVIQRFKGADPIIGHIMLETVVRSRLASLGVELL